MNPLPQSGESIRIEIAREVTNFKWKYILNIIRDSKLAEHFIFYLETIIFETEFKIQWITVNSMGQIIFWKQQQKE